jgi:hypothetical protein
MYFSYRSNANLLINLPLSGFIYVGIRGNFTPSANSVMAAYQQESQHNFMTD